MLLRLYTDGIERGQEFQRFQMKLTGTVALPTYAIVSPFEQKRPIARISGVVAAERFASFLYQGTASFLEQSLAARD